MQGKGIVKFFLVVMTLVCLVQYFFFLPTQKIERQAESYAQEASANAPEEDKNAIYKKTKSNFLDSMSDETVFSIPLIKDFSYQELKSRQLALGLDLKGGMSVVLRVDLEDFLERLSNKSNDSKFREALKNATQQLQNTQSDYVTLFGDEYLKLNPEPNSLARIFATNAALREDINYETSNGQVIRVLREKATETVGLTFKRLKDRIDEFGVTQPNVSLDAARDLILVELPGVDNPERAKNLLKATAKLEFFEVYRINDNGIQAAFINADQKLKKLQVGDTSSIDVLEIDTIVTFEPVLDSLGNPTDDSLEVVSYDTLDGPSSELGPLLSIFQLNGAAGGQINYSLALMGTAKKNQMDKVSRLLNTAEVKRLFPKDIAFKWAADPIATSDGEELNEYMLYGIKVPSNGTALLEGDRIVKATSAPDPQTGRMEVLITMDNQGARIWRDMTTKAANDNNREVAILLDDKVVSAPGVNEPIPSGSSSIAGSFSVQEAQDLANILEIGKLPADIQIVQDVQIGPSLGAENIRRSIQALLIGFSLVLLFMIFYYGGAGIVSILALFLNLFFIFGALASYGTVLTLPGIAGIVLTIGMAVDANVIIYERIREELREGKTLLASIQDGFQNSYSAIIDANVTTILTAFVLAYFGLGPIKGFAVVLIIGVLSSLFTAVLVGRLMIDWWTKKDRPLTFYTKMTKNAFANLKIDWLGKRRIAYVISGLILLVGLGSMFMRGFELGVDFKGGYSYNIQFEESQQVDVEALKASLTQAFEGATPVVKAVSTANAFNVTTSYKINDTSDDAEDQVMVKLHEGVNALLGGNVDFKQFKDADGIGTHINSSSKVGPTIADDIKQSAFYAAILALILIFAYIFIRFNKWQYSLGAVAALFHDTLLVLSVFSLFYGVFPFSLEIDQAFIAAILTVIGYSINDTVVVFDRIREFMNSYTNKTKKEIVNMAINSTISRTIITSLTTLFVVLILFLFGGDSIRGFAFALLIGIVVGTYSSVFVATPIMSDLTNEIEAKDKSASRKRFSKATS